MANDLKPAITLVVGGEALLVERAIDHVVKSARKADPETERRDLDATDAGIVGLIESA